MTITSSWPLPKDGIRFLTPPFIITDLQQHPLLTGPYPLALGYYPNASGHHLKRLRHTNYLLIYCVAGKGVLRTEKQALEVTAGTLTVIPPGVAHEYAADKESPWSIYWVHFEGPVSKAFYLHLDMRALTENIGFHQSIISNFETNFELRRTQHDLSAFLLGCHSLHRLLSHLALLIKHHRTHKGIDIDIDEIRQIMQEHLQHHLSLDKLASELQLSKYYFSKRFKSMVGTTPMRYFINLKMQRACQLLDRSQQSVKEISSHLGYDDPYYFSRLFKKSIGLSPKQYRASIHR